MIQTTGTNILDETTLENKVQVRFDNIYMIDDDSFTLNLNRYCIEKYDLLHTNLLGFQNAEEAIKSLEEADTDKTHLVLVDLNMPIMCGWEFINVISATFSKKLLDSLFISIVSSSSNPIDTDRAHVHPNIFSYIEKPLLPRKYEKMIMAIDATLSTNKS